MKVSNLILRLLFLCCAVGSAVAAKILAPQSTWVSAVNSVGLTTCSTIDNYCTPSTGNSANCRVLIQLSSGVTVPTIGYNSNTCVTPHKGNGVAIAAANKPNLLSVKTYTFQGQ